ncbi:hypothetical protein HYI36_07540 [Bacillus sp. Gen3]|nr:hypothetical protein [Bacillus sp. Gen3]
MRITKKRVLFIILLCIVIIFSLLFLKKEKKANHIQSDTVHAKKEKRNQQQMNETISTVDSNGSSYLQKEGDKVIEKNWAQLELIKKHQVNKDFFVGNMTIHLHTIKIIKLNHIKKEAKNILNDYTASSFNTLIKEGVEFENIGDLYEAQSKSMWTIENEVYYIEINYTITNHYDREVQFFSFLTLQYGDILYDDVPFSNFNLSEDTFMGSSAASRIDYPSGQTREGKICLLIKNKPPVTNKFTFTTDDVLDGITHELIDKKKTVQIKL